jgi:hypothetical protein
MEYHKYILASECFDEEEKKKAKKDLVDIIVEVRELPKWVIVKCNFNGCIDKIQSYHKICLLLITILISIVLINKKLDPY